MKTYLNQFTSLLVALTLLATACETPEELTLSEGSASKIAYSESTNMAFSYGTEVIYLNQTQNKVTPTLQTGLSGTFEATPKGLLSIDPNTGEIDLRQSETGLTYDITFTPDDGSAPVSQKLLISGIDYRQGLFDKETIGQLMPVYNDDPSMPMPRGTFSASNPSLKVDPITGVVDLHDGSLQKALGDDGHGIFTIKYKLDDESQMTTNRIQLEIYQFSSREKVPEMLLEKVSMNTYQRNEGDTTVKRPPTVIIING